MKKILLTSVLLLSMLFSAGCGETAEGTEMSLMAINVRKADALLLRSGKSAYLIDTGVKKTHADHTGGLKALLESEIVVENIYTAGYYALKKEDGKHPVEKAIKKTDYTYSFLFAGDELPLDGGKLTVIGPLEKDEELENNNSLVLLAEGGGGSILLTGDMEFPEEDSLLKAGVIPHADVLKIGNHGEGDATSRALLAAVNPSLAVISTNTEDEPDTPDPRVLKELKNMGIPVLITQDSQTGILVTLRNGEILTEMK